MKKLTVLIAILVLLGGSGMARADPVYLPGVSVLGGYNDVNKTDVYGADSLLCWAAAASNVLAWAGWYGWDSATSSLLDSAGEIYATFDTAWNNRTGAATYAYEWWMTGRTQSNIVVPGYTFDSPGLDFYPTVHVQDGDPSGVTAFADITNNLESMLDYYVAGTATTDPRGVVMAITVGRPGGGGTYSHALTVWGYDPTANQIYVTDSDDGGAAALKTYSYSETGGYLIGYSNLYTTSTDAYVTQLTRLNRNDTGIPPDHGTVAGVPEPSTLLLLGAGLCGLAFSRKKVLR